MKRLWLAWLAMPFLLALLPGCRYLRAYVPLPPLPTPAPTVSPAPATPTPVETPAQPRPTAEPTTRVQVSPPLIGLTGREPVTRANGHVELTQTYATDVPADVLGEVPCSRDQCPEWWNQCHWIDGKWRCGAKSCDDHHYWVGLDRTVMWWVCGGSQEARQAPRHWDDFRGFDVSSTGSVTVTYPCYRKGDMFNLCVKGVGTVSICAKPDARTCSDPEDHAPTCPSGTIPLRVRTRCTTRQVNVP